MAVVEDHPVYRSAVTAAVEGCPDLVHAFSCGSVEEFEALVPDSPVDVAVLDLRLPGADGPEGVARVAGRGAAVLVLSAGGSRDDVVAAFAAGAGGYLTKAAEASEIIEGVRAVARGDKYVAAAAAGHLVAALRDPLPAPRQVLSAREREVLALVAAGRTDQSIAQTLFIGLTTVRSHLDSIRGKTGRRRRAELTRLAIEEGLVPPGSGQE